MNELVQDRKTNIRSREAVVVNGELRKKLKSLGTGQVRLSSDFNYDSSSISRALLYLANSSVTCIPTQIQLARPGILPSRFISDDNLC